MIVRAGIGQWPGRASERALDLPSGPVLTSDTGTDRLSPRSALRRRQPRRAGSSRPSTGGPAVRSHPGRHETTVRESADQVRAMLISGWQDLGTRFTEFGWLLDEVNDQVGRIAETQAENWLILCPAPTLSPQHSQPNRVGSLTLRSSRHTPLRSPGCGHRARSRCARRHAHRWNNNRHALRWNNNQPRIAGDRELPDWACALPVALMPTAAPERTVTPLGPSIPRR